jgi:hypothetical protein
MNQLEPVPPVPMRQASIVQVKDLIFHFPTTGIVVADHDYLRAILTIPPDEWMDTKTWGRVKKPRIEKPATLTIDGYWRDWMKNIGSERVYLWSKVLHPNYWWTNPTANILRTSSNREVTASFTFLGRFEYINAEAINGR